MNPSHEVNADRRRDVLVGMDGSAHSERAFRAGLRVAKNRDVPLRLVGTFPRLVMTDSSYVTMMNDYVDACTRETQLMLSEYVSAAEEQGVKVTTRALVGDPGQVLVDESRTAALAVVGKRGRNRFSGRFLGSVSSKLAAHGHCPTLVIPEKWVSESSEKLLAPAQDLPPGDEATSEALTQVEESSPPEKDSRRTFANVGRDLNFDSEVVVGVDVSDHTVDVANLAAQAAEMLDNPLTLVSAVPLNAEGWYPNTIEHNLEIPRLRRPYLDHLQTTAEQLSKAFPDLTVRWQFFDGSAAGVLSEASRTASLIVIGTRGHGGFTGLLLGSVSQAVLTRAVCPVLVVPTGKH